MDQGDEPGRALRSIVGVQFCQTPYVGGYGAVGLLQLLPNGSQKTRIRDFKRTGHTRR